MKRFRVVYHRYDYFVTTAGSIGDQLMWCGNQSNGQSNQLVVAWSSSAPFIDAIA